MHIDGVAAIIAGGASGLGAATASRLTALGARVAILDLQREALEEKAAELGVLGLAADVSDGNQVTAALDRAEAVNGKARILVNCAGIGPPQKTIRRDGSPHDLADFERILKVNLLGSFNLLSKFAARLHSEPPIGEERGVIVNTASVAAYDGQIGQAAYSASKGGIVGMTLPIARDLSQHRIRVMTIAPGLFLTPLLQALPDEALESLGRQVPHPPRLGDPAEYAQLVEAIIANPMLNGEVIRLDGAIRMAPR